MKQNKFSAARVRRAKQESNLSFANRLSACTLKDLRRAAEKSIFGLMILALCCGFAGIVRAQTPGTLDATFGTGGKVVTQIGNASDGVSGVAIQADGKIVAAGYSGSGSNTDFAVARYNTNGTLDATFGSGGRVVTPIGSSSDFASSVVIQADGKIVVAGYAEVSTTTDFAVARYNTDGTLDATFGSGGRVVTPIGILDDFASAIALQTDGKIVVAGATETGVFTNDFALVRYNVNGTLDATFGTDGEVVTPIGSSDDFASAIALQADGRIVVAGSAAVTAGTSTTDDFALVRYNVNGTLDATFGAGGRVVTPIGSSDDFASAIALQADGKIVVAGDTNNGTNDFALVRYNVNGTLDATFGAGGRVVTPIGSSNDYLAAMAIQANGRIVVAGSAAVTVGTSTTDDFGVARYNTDGTLDATFGAGGKVITPIGSSDDFASAIALQADGKIIVAGSTNNGTNPDFALTRYFGAGVANNPVPAIVSLSPNNRLIGSAAFELTITGSNFVAGSIVRFNNQDRATTFVSDTQLRAQITAADLQTAGQFPVTVFNPAPGGGTSNAVVFTVGACSYTLNSNSLSVTNAGGTGTVSVTTQPGCAYTAVSNSPFITVTAGASGNGNGTITFTVAANTGPARTGTITIAGQTFTVQQSDGCTYSLTPTSANFGNSGGTGSFTVNAGAGCAYAASTTSSFITVTNAAGTGSGAVTFTVAANAGTDRTGTITVNGQTFTVNQSGGCTYTLTPTSTNFGRGGGGGRFNVVTGAGCNWTATTDNSWIIINNASGSGNGIVTFTVNRNNFTADRVGLINVNGQIFTVNQAGGCMYVINPTSANFSASGGIGGFDLTTELDCFFTVVSSVSWIVINSGGNGSPGNVNFTVQPNTTSVARSGTIMINDQIFTVNQAAGNANARRTAFDYDGDGKADISVFRPENGIWYLLNSNTGFTGVQFGVASDRLAPADYDGDGRTDVAVYRDGTWYLQRSTAGFTGIAFGAATDVPAPADYDGDGRAELAVYRPSNGTWYFYNLTNNQTSGFTFGAAEDRPVAGDYDGDGKTDVAVFRPSNGIWYIQRSNLGFTGLQFGIATDKTVQADYDGDGRTDVAVYRDGTWYLNRSTAGFTGIAFGVGTDAPTPADYDGDGRADVAVFREGTWYLQRSTDGFTGVGFGAATDRPAPNAFVR